MQPPASRSEPLKHQPKFELPARHRYAGKSGNEMVAHVLKHRADELGKWREEHKAKLNFGTHNTAEETNRYAALLFALKEVFADNPKAPPMIEGVEFALHFKHSNPKPLCRKIPKLTVEQKEEYSKQALSMLVNGIIEFSDSDWATVPVFAPKKDGGIRTALDYRISIPE